MPVYLPLTHGAPVIIDDGDLALVSKWHLWTDETRQYARASIRLPDGNRGNAAMHRMLLNFPPISRNPEPRRARLRSGLQPH